uniref:Putative secreted peptide n=1 Tax=Anopheles braziliensis TaxID=58242 RepID=A0A2M3ZU64_9DIPT
MCPKTVVPGLLVTFCCCCCCHCRCTARVLLLTINGWSHKNRFFHLLRLSVTTSSYIDFSSLLSYFFTHFFLSVSLTSPFLIYV